MYVCEHGVVKELLEIVHAAMNMINNDREATMMSWDQVHRATQEDGVLVRLMDMDKDLREYHRFRHDLHMVEGVVCYRDRIVIPMALRDKVLSWIHAAHQGASGMTGRIDYTVLWPGIHPDILKTRGSYMICVREAPSQPA